MNNIFPYNKSAFSRAEKSWTSEFRRCSENKWKISEFLPWSGFCFSLLADSTRLLTNTVNNKLLWKVGFARSRIFFNSYSFLRKLVRRTPFSGLKCNPSDHERPAALISWATISSLGECWMKYALANGIWMIHKSHFVFPLISIILRASKHSSPKDRRLRRRRKPNRRL